MYRLKNESHSVFSAVKRGSKKKKVLLIENGCVGSLQSGERWAPPGGDSCFSWTWAIFIEVSIGLWKRPSCVCKAKWWKARHKDFFLFFFLPVPHSLLISIYCCGFVGHLRPVPHSLHRWDQPGLRSSAERWVQHWRCSASSPRLCESAGMVRTAWTAACGWRWAVTGATPFGSAVGAIQQVPLQSRS